LGVVLLFLLNLRAVGQCVVINEVMINGPGSCDGACSPHTEEWFELYNTCNYPVNIGCHVIADGDFTIRIPAGTMIPAYGFYTIGSNNSGGTVNLNISTCGCASGSGVGVLTNAGEQVLLLDGVGNVLDAIVWGGGQFPVFVSAPSASGCPGVNLSFQNVNSTSFEDLPNGGANGCTLARACDGSSIWVQRCSSTITMGESNGTPPFPQITSEEALVCPGSCVDFTGGATGLVAAWSWNFPGSDTPSSGLQNPVAVCYPVAGVYDVELTITTGCGDFSVTGEQWVIVEEDPDVMVIPGGPLALCPGESAVLTAVGSGSFQWFQDGNPTAIGSGSQLTVNSPGMYMALASVGVCSAMSFPVTVNAVDLPAPTISPAGPLVICAGYTTNLTASNLSGPAQWLRDGVVIPGATAPIYTASLPGVYTVAVSASSCTVTSNPVEVQVNPLPSAAISPGGLLSICPGQAILLTANPGYTSYQWYYSGAPVAGATSNTFSATSPGNYSLQVNHNGCIASSGILGIASGSIATPAITANGTMICPGSSLLLTASAGFSGYQWVLNNQPIAGANGQSIQAYAAGSYTVIGSQGQCTAESQPFSAQLSDLPNPIVTAQGPASFCEGGDVLLVVSPSFTSCHWELNGTLIPGATANTLLVSTSGFYSVAVDDGQCLLVSNEVEVVVNPFPVLAVFPEGNQQICQGEEAVYTATGQGALHWEVNGAPAGTGNSIAIGEPAGVMLTLTAPNGCSVSWGPHEVSVISVETVTINAPAGTSACQGDSLPLEATGNWSTYNWSINGTPGPTGPNISATNSGVYEVNVLSAEGCTTQAFISINLQAGPSVTISGSPGLVLCADEAVILTASGGASWAWQMNGVPLPGMNAASLSVDQPGTYTVTASSPQGCSSQTSVQVVSGAAQEPALFAEPQQPCEGEVVTLSVQPVSTAAWSTGQSGSTIQITTSGTYSVTALGAGGCPGNASIDIEFTPMPVADAGPDQFIGCGEGRQLGEEASGGAVMWYPEWGLDDPLTERPFASPTRTITYLLSVTNGRCRATDYVTVEVECGFVYAPTAFTPDQDGINDAWKPVTSGLIEYDLLIMDRWGNRVFESTNPDEWWMGNVMGGKHYAEPGAYVWRLVVRYDGRPDDDLFTGHVLLVR